MYKSMGGCLFSASQCLNKCSCNVSQCLDTCSCSASQRLWTGAHAVAPRWGAADAEIKVPSDENTELKGSPFKAWSRSVYCQACYAHCQGFPPCLFLPFRSIYLNFFQNISRFFPVLAVANTGSCGSPQNKIGHPAGCWSP